MEIVNMLGNVRDKTALAVTLTDSMRYKIKLLEGRQSLVSLLNDGDAIDVVVELNKLLGVTKANSVKRSNLIEDVSESGRTVILKEVKSTLGIAPLTQELVSITVVAQEGVLPAFEELVISLVTTKEKLDLDGNLLYLILNKDVGAVVYVSSLRTLKSQLDTILQNNILEIGVCDT